MHAASAISWGIHELGKKSLSSNLTTQILFSSQAMHTTGRYTPVALPQEASREPLNY